MTIVSTVDEIAAWLEANVCQQVKLKLSPPDPYTPVTDRYEYELVHPTVFPLYVPTTTGKPPHVKATTPAICVQLVKGTDDAFARQRSTKLRLTFSAWDPGIHGPDRYSPEGSDNAAFGRVYTQGEDGTFEPSHEGWRDVWNFVDVALRAIESARSLGSYVIDPSVPIEFGAYDEDGAIADYYPLWFAWIELAVKSEITSADPAIGELLY